MNIILPQTQPQTDSHLMSGTSETSGTRGANGTSGANFPDRRSPCSPITPFPCFEDDSLFSELDSNLNDLPHLEDRLSHFEPNRKHQAPVDQAIKGKTLAQSITRHFFTSVEICLVFQVREMLVEKFNIGGDVHYQAFIREAAEVCDLLPDKIISILFTLAEDRTIVLWPAIDRILSGNVCI